MELIKAIPCGALLTGIVALIIGSTGSTGGQLAIHAMPLGSYDLLWSWPLFFAATALAWGLMVMQR